MARSEFRKRWGRVFNRWIGHPLSGVLTWVGLGLMRALPVDVASGLGGGVARSIGPLLPVSRRSTRNLKRCFPEMSTAERAVIVRDSWENLGRVAGEYAHLDKFDASGNNPRVEVIGREHVEALRDDGLPGIFFSAHLANWEMVSMVGTAAGLPLTRVYRRMNAPMAERLLRRGASPVLGELVPKGRKGAIRLNQALKDGGHLGIMVDQKLNEGIEIPFLGHPAMTAPALASFALKYRCPVVPIRAERLGGAHFRVIVDPPLELPDTGDREADIRALMTQVNDIVGGWVRAKPGQWLWLHRRWRD
jgi:KDO2-lipid IV(A) lauroyltransferase